jgi:hypothetical protein
MAIIATDQISPAATVKLGYVATAPNRSSGSLAHFFGFSLFFCLRPTPVYIHSLFNFFKKGVSRDLPADLLKRHLRHAF